MQGVPLSARQAGSAADAAARPATRRAGRPEITQLLRAWRDGDEAAFSQLLPLIYDELRVRAKRCLAVEARGHLLQPTALVHELYCRFAGSPPEVEWEDRGHFF